MWPNIRKSSALFTSAVITGLDAEGYPFSIRCVPVLDDTQQVIRIAAPTGASIQPGQVSLLFHQHDQQLWNLKMFQVLGRLELSAEEWVLRPERTIPSGEQSIWQDLMMIVDARRAAKQYLVKRGLARPRIPWDRIRSFYPEESKPAQAPQPNVAAKH
jgi:hypothetical protein